MDNEKNTEVTEVKVSSKRIKKAERREAKAARKAANRIEEKKTTPNNALIALLIFGVVIAMFAFVLCYNFFSKPATIEKYLEKNGGTEMYSGMQVDAYTKADLTAKGNSISIALTIDDSDKDAAKLAKEFYAGDEGEEQLKNLTAYFLTSFKPQTRAFSADAKASVKLGDEELNTVEMTYKEAKKYIEDAQKEAEKEAEDGADSGESAEDEADAGDEAADAAEDGE